MRMLLPPIDRRREMDKNLVAFFRDHRLIAFRRAIADFCRYYHLRRPQIGWYEYIDWGKTAGRTFEDGRIHLVHPENWKRGRIYNSERMWVQMVYHELAHYLFWTDAESKAETFTHRMVRGLRRTPKRARVAIARRSLAAPRAPAPPRPGPRPRVLRRHRPRPTRTAHRASLARGARARAASARTTPAATSLTRTTPARTSPARGFQASHCVRPHYSGPDFRYRYAHSGCSRGNRQGRETRTHFIRPHYFGPDIGHLRHVRTAIAPRHCPRSHCPLWEYPVRAAASTTTVRRATRTVRAGGTAARSRRRKLVARPRSSGPRRARA